MTFSFHKYSKNAEVTGTKGCEIKNTKNTQSAYTLEIIDFIYVPGV